MGNGITLTDEKANFYFSVLEEKEGELTLDDLAAVAGGYIGQPSYGSCSSWICVYCGVGPRPTKYYCSDCHRRCGCQLCVHNEQRAADNTCARYSPKITEVDTHDRSDEDRMIMPDMTIEERDRRLRAFAGYGALACFPCGEFLIADGSLWFST